MSRKSVGLALVFAGGLSGWIPPTVHAQPAPVVSNVAGVGGGDGLTPPAMALIPAGIFEMGDHHDGMVWSLPVHPVILDAFYMDRYEVTNQQYADALNWAYQYGLIYVGGDNVVYGTGNNHLYCLTTASYSYTRITWNGNTFGVVTGKENHPMIVVSWYGAAAYANWRSAIDGRTPSYDTSTWTCNFAGNGYRLPTEAEWEYAARGGNYNPYYRYPWGDTLDGSKANYWASGDPYESGAYPWTTPVGYYNSGQTPPGTDMGNGYGLYDMAGNALEWVHDWYGDYPSGPSTNPRGPASGQNGYGSCCRVLRGGSWNDLGTLRCADRVTGFLSDEMGYCCGYVGFRLALDSWAVLPNNQPQVGDDQPGNKVKLDHLWQWSDPAGRFVDPGPNGVTINPNLPTYLLTHGWDGDLSGNTCGTLPEDSTCDAAVSPNDAPKFAMSSIGAAIFRATRNPDDGTPGANLLAWDWAGIANPNTKCDLEEALAAGEASIDELWTALKKLQVTQARRIITKSLADLRTRVEDGLADAYNSGVAAKNEGDRLGQALADVLDAPKGTLGSELHLIGKSHGGGVLGQAAKKLKLGGHPVASLTTLDTPKTLCERDGTCHIDSLQYVDPSAASHTAVYYYLQTLPSLSLRGAGFGAPIQPPQDNLTNLSLNPSYSASNLFGRILHLWIAGFDNCRCQPDGAGWALGECAYGDGWYSNAVWDHDAGEPATILLDGGAKSVLECSTFPSGTWEESLEREFYRTDVTLTFGACCRVVLGIPLCTVETRFNCGSTFGNYVGDGTWCMLGTCGAATASTATVPQAQPKLSALAYEPFFSASTWSGNLTYLVIGADPDDPPNRVILMQEQGDASFFKDINWPNDAAVMTFDYLFREPRGKENLTIYVDNQIVYYDNAETTLARDHLTGSGAIYVGNVAGRNARLNFVFRTDVPEGGTLGGELVIDNIRVYGFLEADSDLDGDRDLADFAVLQRCFGATPMPDECWAFDVDGLEGVGLSDYAGDIADPPQFKGFVQFIGDNDHGGPRAVPIP